MSRQRKGYLASLNALPYRMGPTVLTFWSQAPTVGIWHSRMRHPKGQTKRYDWLWLRDEHGQFWRASVNVETGFIFDAEAGWGQRWTTGDEVLAA